MNDYIFLVKVSNKDGSNVRQKKIPVCAENIEKAYSRVQDKIAASDSFQELISVEKL